MTKEEVASEMGAAVQELAEIRKRRACLQTRAERMKATLRQGVTRIDDALAGTRGVRYEPAMGADGWPTFGHLLSMIADINGTTVRIDELENRLRQWGVIE